MNNTIAFVILQISRSLLILEDFLKDGIESGMGAGIGSVEVVGIGTGEGVGVEIKLDKSDAVGGK